MNFAVEKNLNNWASTIGHPCLRYLYLKRTLPHLEVVPPEKMALFKEGQQIELQIIDQFKKQGFEIVEIQKKFEIKEYKIAGKIDCILRYSDIVYPCEIKSASESVFEKIYTYQSLQNNEHYYIRMYPTQLQLYLYATNSKNGYFYIKNKKNGAGKFIKVEYSETFVKEIFQKVASINNYVDRNEIPNKIDDISICKDCGFYGYCYKEEVT
jgi:Holliday junction resolvase-like predicted endonuclease